MKNVASVLIGAAFALTTLGAVKKNGRVVGFGLGCGILGAILIYVH